MISRTYRFVSYLSQQPLTGSNNNTESMLQIFLNLFTMDIFAIIFLHLHMLHYVCCSCDIYKIFERWNLTKNIQEVYVTDYVYIY